MTSMPFFDGRTGQVHFRHWPAAGGAVPTVSLVFLHGLGQHSGQYHRFAGAMTASGIDVWAIDHTGHGLSEGDPGVGSSRSPILLPMQPRWLTSPWRNCPKFRRR